MQTCTAIIPRPAHAKPIRVLEVDGPNYHKRPVQRGEGSYYLHTSNYPPCDDLTLYSGEPLDTTRFKTWGDPHWDLYLHLTGRYEVMACRPTDAEGREGDLVGELGSEIHIRIRPDRRDLKNALRLARRLCTCDPVKGITVEEDELVGITSIISDIPVYCALRR